jgi:hypothetical protein
MRRSAILALPLAAVLLIPASASAKELKEIRVCGAEHCRTITDHGARADFENGAVATSAPSAAAPFYVVHMVFQAGREEHEAFPMKWVPSTGTMRSDDDGRGTILWTRPDAVLVRALERAVRGLAPRPASELGPLSGDSSGGSLPAESYDPAGQEKGGGVSTLGVAGIGGGAALLLAIAAVGGRRLRRGHG